jgi:Rrf2 family iron-sulfur cluster assembly transcriptional regulator
MKLSTKGRYAVTAMLDLAIHNTGGPVTLADISQCQDISLSYLEQLFARLRRNGLVRGVRGPGGGYNLARDIHEITVADVIRAVDESVDVTRCGGYSNCQEGAQCLTHNLWSELSDQIYEFLSSVTLADLIEHNSVKEIACRQDNEKRRVFLPRSRSSAAVA